MSDSPDAGPSTPRPSSPPPAIPSIITPEPSTSPTSADPSSPPAAHGPSSPLTTPSSSLSSSTTTDAASDLRTPAPVQPLTPSAPPPNPPAKDLPLRTPSSSLTPSRPGPPSIDISEFDPYATPAPSQPEPSSAPARQNRTPRNGDSGGGRRMEEAGTPGEGGGGGKEEPAFNFAGFLKDLRVKSAEPVARYLKSFLSNFAKKPFTVNEQIKLIHDFLRFIADKMVQVEPWKSQGEAEFDNAMEAMEKLVMNRLYNYTFTPQLVPSQQITTDDLERDAVFAQRVRLFSWIREKHLDVPEGETSQGFLGFAEQELLKINHYKAPRDKMICILNCCKVIFGLIRHTYGAEGTSADAFVPILIFVVLRANPENMLSNIEYINRFRTPSKLSGEAGYYLSSLTGAIAFIETMDASSLSSITQAEFESNVETAIQALPPSPSALRPSRALPPAEMSPFAATSPGEEPARMLNSHLGDSTKRFFQRTGEQVTEAVSKPLNAIGKILEGIQQQQQDEGDGEDERDGNGAGGMSTPRRAIRAVTPDSPSSRFAQLGISPDESLPTSRAATPSRDYYHVGGGGGGGGGQDPSHLQSTLDMSQEAYAAGRRANVATLKQMFPALDEDVLEGVLEGYGDDLGVAIDRLLEM